MFKVCVSPTSSQLRRKMWLKLAHFLCFVVQKKWPVTKDNFHQSCFQKQRNCTAAAILVGGHNCRTQFWKRTIKWLFHQRLVLIELLVPDKMQDGCRSAVALFLKAALIQVNDYRILGASGLKSWSWISTIDKHLHVQKYICSRYAILVRGRDHQTQFWKRTIQWLFYQNLVPIEQLTGSRQEDFYVNFP
jgi:hypothetical protein